MMKRLSLHSSADNTSGFTLLEVLVVIVIIGVLAAIAGPGWLGYVNRQRINRTRSDLVQIIQNAQTAAQQRNSAVTIEFEEGPGTPGGPIVQVNSLKRTVGGENNGQMQLIASHKEFEFNYRGEPVQSPYIVSVVSSDNLSSNISSRRCVIVPTLLGGIVQAQGDKCDTSLYD